MISSDIRIFLRCTCDEIQQRNFRVGVGGGGVRVLWMRRNWGREQKWKRNNRDKEERFGRRMLTSSYYIKIARMQFPIQRDRSDGDCLDNNSRFRFLILKKRKKRSDLLHEPRSDPLGVIYLIWGISSSNTGSKIPKPSSAWNIFLWNRKSM